MGDFCSDEETPKTDVWGNGGAGGASAGNDGAEGSGPGTNCPDHPQVPMSEEEAHAALDDLTSLTPEQQNQAMADIPPERMDEILATLPDWRKQELYALAQNTGDMDLKAKLYGGYLEGRVAEELELHTRTDEDPADPAAQASYNGAIDRAASGDRGEIAHEVAELRERMKKGEPITEQDILDVVDRKEKELRIEMDYGVNLTADKDDKGKLVRWKDGELDKLEEVLDKMPEQHRNDVLQYRRELGNGAAEHTDDGSVHVHDGGIGMLKGAFIHETAHDVEKQNPELMEEYMKAAGWQQFKGEEGARALQQQLQDAGLGEEEAKLKAAEIQALRSKKELDVDGIEVNGKIYRPGKYHDGIDCYDNDAVPTVNESDNSQDGWRDEWVYARTSPAEMWADHYKRAVRDPVGLYRDLVDRPAQKLEETRAYLETVKADPNASDEEVAELEAQIEEQTRQKDRREQMWQTMRQGVFKVDDEAVDVAAQDLDPAQEDAFREQAKHCTTPEQLATLAKDYKAGKQVDDGQIDTGAQQVPADQQEAFRRDAANCFTQEQLRDLTKAYAEKRRENQDWVRGKNNGGKDIYLGWA